MQTKGLEIDQRPGCAHWRTEKDLIAIRLPCCENYYACFECHAACENHVAKRWPKVLWDKTPAILCRACDHVITIVDYMAAEAMCPHCAAQWNPKCRNHWHLYFEVGNLPETAVEKARKA